MKNLPRHNVMWRRGWWGANYARSEHVIRAEGIINLEWGSLQSQTTKTNGAMEWMRHRHILWSDCRK